MIVGCGDLIFLGICSGLLTLIVFALKGPPGKARASLGPKWSASPYVGRRGGGVGFSLRF